MGIRPDSVGCYLCESLERESICSDNLQRSDSGTVGLGNCLLLAARGMFLSFNNGCRAANCTVIFHCLTLQYGRTSCHDCLQDWTRPLSNWVDGDIWMLLNEIETKKDGHGITGVT